MIPVDSLRQPLHSRINSKSEMQQHARSALLDRTTPPNTPRALWGRAAGRGRGLAG